MKKLEFNELVGVKLPSTSEIRADLEQEIKNAFRVRDSDPEANTDPSTPLGQIIDIVVAEIESKNAQLAYLTNQNNPDTARGIFLDGHSALYFLQRKKSESSVVSCVCTGQAGTHIPYGVLVKDIDGKSFRHNVVDGVTIGDSGSVTTTFVSVDHGAIDVRPNTINKIVTVVAGWQSVNNPIAGVVGRERETDSELRSRLEESVAINGVGNVQSLVAELKNISGVIDAVAQENISNKPQTYYGITLEPHSVGVSVFGGDDAAIAKAIKEKKAMGCDTSGSYTVSFSTDNNGEGRYEYKITRPQPVAVAMRITFFASSMDALTQSSVKRAVINDFLGQGGNKRVSFAETLYSSRFYSVIQQVTAVPVGSIEVKVGNGDFDRRVIINADQQPTITESDITFTFAGA
nr:MAG TPA: baseplate wedge protein [Caudoviricetes sp.]